MTGEELERLDQFSVACPVCGKKVQFDRSSDEPQEFFSSATCCEIMQAVIGIQTKDPLFKRRATKQNVCVTCGGILANKARSDSLYCSPKCWKRARRLGISAGSLTEIRVSAIIEALGKGTGRSEEKPQ